MIDARSGLQRSRADLRLKRPLFEARVVSAQFREPVEGVAVREVIEPDVFRHFFGR